MKRNGPMKRTNSLTKTPLKSRSDKRAKFMAEDRVPYIKSLVAAGASCEIGPVLADVGIRPGCTYAICGLHERRKRSAGGSLTNRQNLIPACNICNGAVEDQAGLVRELLGDILIVREGDREWDSLGVRNDDGAS